MTGPRRFSSSQRAALYLAADGRCANCGAELEPGWHADHIDPHSLGGSTDVINGQALCPTCNLKKGNSVTNLRAWQQRATDRFYAKNSTDFLVSATPGAGKTRFALSLARRLKDEGAVERVAVVVPTDALRQQWADQAEAFSLSLMPVAAATDYDKAGYDGCVATYSQVARGAGSDLLRRTTRTPTLAILDEIHHAGENRAWGDGLAHALTEATVRLALTGTPWRSDPSAPIPFVRYDDAGRVCVDYSYEYGAAVADGVCRGVVFDAYEGEGRWTDCGKVESAALGADLNDDDLPALLDTVYHPDNSWMPTLLAEANTALEDLRTEVADAAGLVIAERQWHAQAYADTLRKITGTSPTVVISDDPGAKDAINRFRRGNDRWIVAVKMVSEGVDIPRLAVGVYASKTRTPLFFRQVVGRFVRTRDGEELNARLFIPAVPALMQHARTIEEELRHQLDVETERERKARAEAENDQRTFELREALSATPAVFDRSIFAGDEISPEERERAAEQCRRQGIPIQYAVNVAKVLRGQGQPIAEVRVTPAPSPEPRHRREKILRTEVERLSRSLARHEGVDYKAVNAALLRQGFPRRAVATVENLEDIVEFLAKRLGSA